jgi:uncharacterized CHY-type Zn-finger protein
MSKFLPPEIQRKLLRLRAEMLFYLDRTEADTLTCRRCLLPYPEGEYEAYGFCPWCSLSINGCAPRIDESRRIIQNQRFGQDEIQCSECGGEYGQPTRYPFQFCPHCGAPFAQQDELLIELPFLV